MVLPLLDSQDQESIDLVPLEEMIDAYLEAGLTYLDTRDRTSRGWSAILRRSFSCHTISWYLIEEFAKYECNGGDFSRISEVLSTSADVDRIIRIYIATTMSYLMWYESTHMGKGYNDMIKEKIDMVQFNMGRFMAIAQVQLM